MYQRKSVSQEQKLLTCGKPLFGKALLVFGSLFLRLLNPISVFHQKLVDFSLWTSLRTADTDLAPSIHSKGHGFLIGPPAHFQVEGAKPISAS